MYAFSVIILQTRMRLQLKTSLYIIVICISLNGLQASGGDKTPDSEKTKKSDQDNFSAEKPDGQTQDSESQRIKSEVQKSHGINKPLLHQMAGREKRSSEGTLLR